MLKLKKTPSKRIVFTLCAAGICLPLLFTMFYNGYLVRRYEITTDRIVKGHSVKIVLLSDLHSEPSKQRRQAIVKIVKKQQPDFVLYAGDIVDDLRPIDGVRQFLTEMQGIAPTYYAMGNHECYTGNVQKILSFLRKYDVQPLVNDWVDTESGIVIAGAADPSYYASYSLWDKQLREALAPMEQEQSFRILISHRPEPEYAALPVDLVVSGHAHGGQVRIPGLINGLYAPNQGLFPEHTGGLYERAGHLHIVSRGLAVFPILPRVFNPPEVVVIEIHGKSKT